MGILYQTFKKSLFNSWEGFAIIKEKLVYKEKSGYGCQKRLEKHTMFVSDPGGSVSFRDREKTANILENSRNN